MFWSDIELLNTLTKYEKRFLREGLKQDKFHKSHYYDMLDHWET